MVGRKANFRLDWRLTRSIHMWHLIEDFFEQSLVMKGFLGLGWLAIIVMAASFIDGFVIPAINKLIS